MQQPGRMLFFFVLTGYFLVSVSYPRSAFSANTVPFKRPPTSFHAKFPKNQRHKDITKCLAWGTQDSLFKNNDANLRLYQNTLFLNASLIRKSQQNSFELVTWLGELGTMAYQAQSMGMATVAMEECRTRTPPTK